MPNHSSQWDGADRGWDRSLGIKDMEFTKKEQKILSPRHERAEKWTLWLDILFLCLSLALIPYAIYEINRLEKPGSLPIHTSRMK